jgi:integrase
MQVCMAWSTAAAQARDRNLTASQARKVLAEMVAHSTGESLTTYTLESWLAEWTTNKTASASKATMLRYKQVMRDFMECIGGRAKSPLTSITAGDILKFRDELRSEGRAVSTCNVVIKKILSVPFEAARKLGYIPINPVSSVELLKEGGKKRKSPSMREPFTPSEMRNLVSKAKYDWKGAIVLAATTGLRLGDVVGLKWGDLDRTKGFIKIETQKTGEVVNLPIHADFEQWLSKQTQGIGNAPVFPILSTKKINGKNGLSMQFRDIMKAAGVVEKVIAKAGDAGRQRFSKGFHAIRHTFVSTLANANVPEEVRQKLTAHSDKASHQIYTTIDLETFTAAVKKIPSVL